MRGRPASVPAAVGLEVAIESGGETVGAALALGDGRAGGAGPPARGLRRRADGAGDGGRAHRGRGEPARLVPRAAARRGGRGRDGSCGAPRASAATCRTVRSRCAPSRRASASATSSPSWSTRRPARWPSSPTTGASTGSSRRRGGRLRSRADAARRVAARLRPHGVGRAVVLPRRPATLGLRWTRRRWCWTSPGWAGCGRRRRRHLPAAVPRPRVPPRGGPLVLRRHDRAAGPLRRAVRLGAGRDARGVVRARLLDRRHRRRDLRPPPHGRLPAGAGEGAVAGWILEERGPGALGAGIEGRRVINPQSGCSQPAEGVSARSPLCPCRERRTVPLNWLCWRC